MYIVIRTPDSVVVTEAAEAPRSELELWDMYQRGVRISEQGLAALVASSPEAHLLVLPARHSAPDPVPMIQQAVIEKLEHGLSKACPKIVRDHAADPDGRIIDQGSRVEFPCSSHTVYSDWPGMFAVPYSDALLGQLVAASTNITSLMVLGTPVDVTVVFSAIFTADDEPSDLEWTVKF